MSLKNVTERLVSAFSERPTVRAGSLIITVFGDAILPRGGTVWIGSLIRVLQDFGINERLVRTSVFRLTRDSWLEAEQVGRCSYYRLTNTGVEEFERATIRIYGDPRQHWSGEWCLVLLADLDGERKEAARKELGWLGFGAISTSVLAHPSPDIQAVEAALQRAGADRELVIMQGKTLGRKQDDAMRELVHKSWNLQDVDQRYATFVKRFTPVLRALQKSRKPEQRQAFLVRTLLIHEYRRILLRDPLLPVELLPAKWNGRAAYQLCRKLYLRVHAPADLYISDHFEIAEGALPLPRGRFYERFGGLN